MGRAVLRAANPVMDSNSPVTAEAKRRVFIVDDHPLVRESLTTLINREADLHVCGQADSAASALTGIAEHQPDIAILDLTLGDGPGTDLIRAVRALPNKPLVLVLSMHDEGTHAERALRAGAHGYVMKREATSRVLEGIRHVLRGELYLNPSVALNLAQKVFGAPRGAGSSPDVLLSHREMQVFTLLGRGYETNRIADEMRISRKTVQVFCGRIKEKLGATSFTQLVREAVRWVDRSAGES